MTDLRPEDQPDWVPLLEGYERVSRVMDDCPIDSSTLAALIREAKRALVLQRRLWDEAERYCELEVERDALKAEVERLRRVEDCHDRKIFDVRCRNCD